MPELEQRLRSAMHAAVDAAEPSAGLAAMVRNRHRRYVLRVAAAAAAAIALVAAVPFAVAAARGPRPSGTGVTPSGHGHETAPVRPGPHRPAAARSALRGEPAISVPVLLLSVPQPGYYGPASRRWDLITGLPRARQGYRFARMAGGWLAQPNSGAPACCAGPPLPVFYLADGSLTAVRVGSGYSAAPASSAGKLWLVRYRDRVQRLGTSSATARLTSLNGRPAGPPVTLPAGYLLVRQVGPDLLLKPANKPPLPVRDELWDPATRHVVRDVTGVVAASQATVAWEPACRCAVHVLNVLTGAVLSIPLTAGRWAYSGTFSGDGRYLAMALATSVLAQGGQSVSLAVADIGQRKLRTVPGTAISAAASDRLVFGWQPGQDLLMAALPVSSRTYRGQRIQVGTWRPGAAHLRVANGPIPVGDWVVLGDNS